MLIFTELSSKRWKNKNGTGDRECKCGSWKQHWKNFSTKNWPITCCIYGCGNSANLGAHVISHEVSGEWIIPVCDSCNQRDDIFYVKDGTEFVSANKSKTCE
jgi:hypothetical protein